MDNVNASTKKPRTETDESVSRRVAEELHDRIDKVASKSEQFEQALHERGAKAQVKASELSSSLSRYAQEKPWMVVGGSMALGVLLSALMRRH